MKRKYLIRIVVDNFRKTSTELRPVNKIFSSKIKGIYPLNSGFKSVHRYGECGVKINGLTKTCFHCKVKTLSR